MEQLVYRTKVTNIWDVVYGIGVFLSHIPEVTIIARSDAVVKYKFKDTSTEVSIFIDSSNYNCLKCMLDGTTYDITYYADPQGKYAEAASLKNKTIFRFQNTIAFTSFDYLYMSYHNRTFTIVHEISSDSMDNRVAILSNGVIDGKDDNFIFSYSNMFIRGLTDNVVDGVTKKSIVFGLPGFDVPALLCMINDKTKDKWASIDYSQIHYSETVGYGKNSYQVNYYAKGDYDLCDSTLLFQQSAHSIPKYDYLANHPMHFLDKTYYKCGDIIYNKGSFLTCIKNHLSNISSSNEMENWKSLPYNFHNSSGKTVNVLNEISLIMPSYFYIRKPPKAIDVWSYVGKSNDICYVNMYNMENYHIVQQDYPITGDKYICCALYKRRIVCYAGVAIRLTDKIDKTEDDGSVIPSIQ